MSRDYRHEYKYRIDAGQAALLEARARSVLSLDPHTGPEGSYQIKSLYFDDYHDSCYYESLEGLNRRAKYRIRYYNTDTSFLKLEKKSKENGMTRKESCRITREQCQVFLSGRIPEITGDMPEKMQRLFLEMKLKNLVPKVIVIYERIPFVAPVGNVRITFDRSLMSSHNIGSFLGDMESMRPVFRRGESLMEVKWDELLPEPIANHMALDTLQWTSFSKYVLCRKYNCYGGLRI